MFGHNEPDTDDEHVGQEPVTGRERILIPCERIPPNTDFRHSSENTLTSHVPDLHDAGATQPQALNRPSHSQAGRNSARRAHSPMRKAASTLKGRVNLRLIRNGEARRSTLRA